MHFTLFVIFGNTYLGDFLKDKIAYLGNFNILLWFEKENSDSFENLLTLNTSVFLSALLATLLLQLFIFFEFIYMLKNPIGSASFRTNVYYLVTYISAFIIFIFHLNGNLEDKLDIRKIAEKNTTAILILFSAFILMSCFCFFHLIYSCKRLGFKKFLKMGIYGQFLFKQSLMCLSYMICYIPFFLTIFSSAINYTYKLPEWFEYTGLCLFCSIGMTQFAIRAYDTNFFKLIKKFFVNNLCCCFKDKVNDTTIDEKSKEGVRLFFYVY